MKLRPLHDRIVVKRLDIERTTASGIVIPDNAAEKPDQGEIVAVGNGKITDDALNFLKSNDSKTILKLVLGYLNNNKKIFNNNLAKEILNSISKEHGIKKGLLMRSLRMSFFRCLNGPDLIESWELLSDKRDISDVT